MALASTDRSPSPDEEWPFTGRVNELDRLTGNILTEGSSIVLVGATGVGKTRLARRLLDRAARAGLATAAVTASRTAAEIPFGALASLIPKALEQPAGSVDTRADFLHRCVAALASDEEGRPKVLLVDDGHLLDTASATVLHQAVATRACRLIMTIRLGEAMHDLVVSLWKDGLAVRHEIGGLSEPEIGDLLHAALGDPVDRATVARLARQCEGNVLFLRELVRGAVRSGTLAHEDHLWRLTGPPRLSDRLIELVEARLGDLTVPERELLEVVAFGQPLSSAEVGALSEERVAEELERRGFLVSTQDGRRLTIRTAHPLYAEALLARLPAIRIRRIARVLADVVEGTGARRRDDVLRVAQWRLEGGGVRPDLMLRAATAARWSYDFPLAERLARAALADGVGFEAGLLVGQLAFLQGRGEEAEAELSALAPAAENDAQRARVALARLDCAIFLGQIDTGLQIAEETEAQLADAVWRDQVTARRSGLLLAAAGPRAALDVAVPLLERSEGRGLVWGCLVACLGLGRLGRLDEAIAVADRGHAAQLQLQAALEYYPWLHTYFRGDALIYGGAFDQAEAVARQEYDLAVQQGSTEAQAYFGFQLAKLAVERGDVEFGARQAREAGALFRELGRPALREPCLVELVVSLAISGRRSDAAAARSELEALALSRSYYAVEVLRARAWVAIANGELADARELLESAADLGEELGDLVGAVDALHTVARLGRARSVLPRMEKLVPQVDGRLAVARLAHTRALVADNPDGLDAASATFEDIGANLLAAEAAAGAAAAAQKHATRQQAAALRRRAAATRARVPAASTPALQGVAARSVLTPAEADAALLAAAGYSNREIAERMHLSVRTVEGQLQRCYEKLFVTRRSDLATALTDLGFDMP
jgi:ATP/maltotriose-dependent transcriptional regulator MalT